METETYTDIDTLAKLRVAELCGQIKTNRQLRHIILQVRRDLQQQVYESFVPHLRFKPWSFQRIIK